ncbi:hypothetical protein [Microbacterium lacticum]
MLRDEFRDGRASFVLVHEPVLLLTGWRLTSHHDVILAKQVQDGVSCHAELVRQNLGGLAFAVPAEDLGGGVRTEAP